MLKRALQLEKLLLRRTMPSLVSQGTGALCLKGAIASAGPSCVNCVFVPSYSFAKVGKKKQQKMEKNKEKTQLKEEHNLEDKINLDPIEEKFNQKFKELKVASRPHPPPLSIYYTPSLSFYLTL